MLPGLSSRKVTSRGKLTTATDAKMKTHILNACLETRPDHRPMTKDTMLPTTRPTNPAREKVRNDARKPEAMNAPNRIRSR